MTKHVTIIYVIKTFIRVIKALTIKRSFFILTILILKENLHNDTQRTRNDYYLLNLLKLNIYVIYVILRCETY